MSLYWYFLLKCKISVLLRFIVVSFVFYTEILVCNNIHESPYLLILQYAQDGFKIKILVILASGLNSIIVQRLLVLLAERGLYVLDLLNSDCVTFFVQ